MDVAAHIHAAKMAGSKRLNLSCGLQTFPLELYELADTLEVLDLSGNNLSSLPDDFSRLHKLRVLFCSDNQFKELPEVLGQCTQLDLVGFKANQIRQVPGAALSKNLRWLILTDNQITELPAEIGLCTQLQKLMLAGNQLQCLPHEMAACTRLELLRIAANKFTELPIWLLDLPRLSWLAYAGNPFSEIQETQALTQNPIAEISWQQLEMQHKLGEGASGVIQQAVWQESTEQRTGVAVKLFKGAVTSDGLPHSEMAACISAGSHPNLIGIHGKIHEHPAAGTGLVMSLIDVVYSNLAGPPSLDSCTRDIYATNARYSLDAALRIAHGIASAARQLHERGIMHGDLYAHNILHNTEGDCLLGDFGAASFFSTQDQPLALSLQRIEVRAFACLLEELLARCTTDERTLDSETGMMKDLLLLQRQCAQENAAHRPLFSEIVQSLQSFKNTLDPASL